MKDFFITKYGKKIPINKHYRLVHNISNIKNQNTPELAKNFKATLSMFNKDLMLYSLAIDFLDSLGVKTHWNTSLDIGGREGFISRFLTGEDKVKKADCIELNDYSHSVNTKKMKHFFRLYKLWKLARKFKINYKNNLTLANNFLERQSSNIGYYPNDSSKFWNIKFKKDPNIHEYLVKNIFEHEKRYDLITSFSSLHYFNYKQLFKKISTLLNKNGIFLFWDWCWWWPVNATSIVGYFPYAVQRLDKNDFKRYTEEFHPEESNDMIKRYDWYNDKLDEKPTLNNFFSEAEKNNLSLIGYRRLAPFENTSVQTPFTPNVLDQYLDSRLIDVLEDIHQFRSDVTIEDLKTAFYLVAFKKHTIQGESYTKCIEELQNTNEKDIFFSSIRFVRSSDESK